MFCYKDDVASWMLFLQGCRSFKDAVASRTLLLQGCCSSRMLLLQGCCCFKDVVASRGCCWFKGMLSLQLDAVVRIVGHVGLINEF